MAGQQQHEIDDSTMIPLGKGAMNANTSPASDAPLVPVTPRGEATRRRILDAAEAVFGESGYYEASISEITRRAAVAQGTFYLYFHSKREIFVQLVDDLSMRLRSATNAAIAGAETRIEAERRGFAAFFTYAGEHRRIYRIVQEAERVAPEAAHAYYQRISRGYERGLRAAMHEGEVEITDPEAIAYALMGIAHFVALRWLIWPQEGEGRESTLSDTAAAPLPDAVYTAVMEFVTRGLAAPAAHSTAPNSQ